MFQTAQNKINAYFKSLKLSNSESIATVLTMLLSGPGCQEFTCANYVVAHFDFLKEIEKVILNWKSALYAELSGMLNKIRCSILSIRQMIPGRVTKKVYVLYFKTLRKEGFSKSITNS